MYQTLWWDQMVLVFFKDVPIWERKKDTQQRNGDLMISLFCKQKPFLEKKKWGFDSISFQKKLKKERYK